jgi:two-component sensor histidine kinase
VRVEKTDDGFAFVVSDTGPAFGDAPARKGSIGQTLIHALVRQLRAKRTQSRSETGNELRIAIPNPLG